LFFQNRTVSGFERFIVLFYYSVSLPDTRYSFYQQPDFNNLVSASTFYFMTCKDKGMEKKNEKREAV
jgi:hypothetical protein